VLNELGDVVSDAVLYGAFAWIPGIPPWMVAVVVILSILSEMTGVVGVQIGASRRYDGPLGKSDRAFAFGVLALVLALGVAPGGWISYAFAAASLLLVLTILNRARRAIREAPASSRS
jgi:CDP-diacylglycerol--glycerol-3-phosphate 3-phosphatidyltransferase